MRDFTVLHVLWLAPGVKYMLPISVQCLIEEIVPSFNESVSKILPFNLGNFHTVKDICSRSVIQVVWKGFQKDNQNIDN